LQFDTGKGFQEVFVLLDSGKNHAEKWAGHGTV
jgi:hypothetical protein